MTAPKYIPILDEVQAKRSYTPPTLTRLTGLTAVEVLAASHALLTLCEGRKVCGFQLFGTHHDGTHVVDRELIEAVQGYVSLVCTHLESLTASPRIHDTEAPPAADPTLLTCTACHGLGKVVDENVMSALDYGVVSQVCPACHGQGCT